MKKTWFITGSSRGLGRSLTEAVLAAGDNVAATARNTDDLKELVEKYPELIYSIKLDVTSNEEIKTAIENTIAHFGRIDVLVNNAGFGITGAAEAYTEEQVNSQLATNLYAPIAITRAVLPYMRKQGSDEVSKPVLNFPADFNRNSSPSYSHAGATVNGVPSKAVANVPTDDSKRW